jgi:preprotein translocase subunit SecG
MSNLLIILHVVVCIALILIVLLQTGKGSDIGAAFGAGASQTIFGSQGSSSFLSKLTAVAAVLFLLTSLGLNLIAGGRPSSSVMQGVKAPAAKEAPAAPALPKDTAQPIEKEKETK